MYSTTHGLMHVMCSIYMLLVHVDRVLFLFLYKIYSKKDISQASAIYRQYHVLNDANTAALIYYCTYHLVHIFYMLLL